jgi:hypothetical protein
LKAESATTGWGGNLLKAQYYGLKGLIPGGDPAFVVWTQYAIDQSIAQAKKNAPMALGGIFVSMAPRLPLVKIIAKPADRVVRRFSKGKVSL